MALVAGVDSSTQSCKVVVADADTGEVLREGRAPHPAGTQVDPAAWWTALQAAVEAAGGLADVAALAVGGQQHGMVCLDDAGGVVRPAMLWNDMSSAPAAEALVRELGAEAWAEAVGSVPVASFTVTKLRWLAEHEPEAARRTSAVCLPHDWLTWRLREADLDDLTTDRSDASGTGYWSPATGEYRPDLLVHALGHQPALPRVLGPDESPGRATDGLLLGAGAGDNAASALGLGARPGDVIVSIGTSGVATAVSLTAAADATGTVAGFADATGAFLPLVCTLNAARVLDTTARLLGVDHAGLSDLALSAPPGAHGAVLVPYLEGERTPNLPDATGTLFGLTHESMTPAAVARAAIEGMLCGLAAGIDALVAQGAEARRILLVGGGAASEAVRQIAPTIFGREIHLPPAGEYVARGAARQAAWVLAGSPDAPDWPLPEVVVQEAAPQPDVRRRFREAARAVAEGRLV